MNPVKRVRMPSEVIDAAIRENRAGEYVLYGLSVLFALVGVGTLIYGIVRGTPGTSLAGAIASGLFWPAMTEARKTRKESLAVRLLEAPLSRADTAKEAADMLREVFDSLMLEKAKGVVRGSRAVQRVTPTPAGSKGGSEA
ncbi:MAG: hypothetical protein WCB12_01745 [Bryobacteraceae bacterium]